FFSSRRRHTSFSRDWSSDVCSSDLSRQPTMDGNELACTQDGCPQRTIMCASSTHHHDDHMDNPHDPVTIRNLPQYAHHDILYAQQLKLRSLLQLHTSFQLLMLQHVQY